MIEPLRIVVRGVPYKLEPLISWADALDGPLDTIAATSALFRRALGEDGWRRWQMTGPTVGDSHRLAKAIADALVAAGLSRPVTPDDLEQLPRRERRRRR